MECVHRSACDVPDAAESTPRGATRSGFKRYPPMVDGPQRESTAAQPGEPTVDMVQQEKPARRLGRYELRESIGRGGMGEVFAALDLANGRTVAVKL